jgi:hypothetical protein
MTRAATEKILPAPDAFSRSGDYIWSLLIVFGASVLAVTDKSFWIDECISAQIADHPTLSGVWGSMGRFPEVQLPLFMMYLWGCIQMFGNDEWFLRATGLPWFVAGAGIFITYIGRVTGAYILPALLISWSAFGWYYLNEARVYSAQLGFALAVAGSGAGILQAFSANASRRGPCRLFLAALFLLCGSSILAAMWAAFFCAGFVLLLGFANLRRLIILAPISMSLCALGLIGLAFYYGWTLTLSSKPSGVGSTTPLTLIFVFYELLGSAGLGPGRYELRSFGIGALKPYCVPLSFFAFSSLLLFWQGYRELDARFGRRKVLTICAALLVPLFFLCALGVLTPFRVLGRHATPLLPFFLITLAFGIPRLAVRCPNWGRCVAGLFLILSLVSALSIRFAARHEKDDYRGAAEIARVALNEGKSVWWNADPHGAAYYGLPVAAGGEPSFYPLMNPTLPTLKGLAKPDLIIVSKPDSYDVATGVTSYIREHRYLSIQNLRAFLIYGPPP